MARASTSSGVPWLGWWLMAIGTVRLVLTWSCFFGGAARAALCSAAQMSDIHARTVAAWTLLSSTLCFLCAFNLGDRPLYAATFLPFVYVYGYLLVEHLVYRTVRVANLAALGFVEARTPES